jgi:hypothetical protein
VTDWPLARLLSPRDILGVTLRRIEGLTDDEMLWEPVAGCMTVRDGEIDPLPREPHHYDGGFDPVTTIGWRLGHIASGITEERVVRWLGVDGATVPPPSISATAAGMSAWLATAVDWWSSLVEGLDDGHLSEPIGPVGGMFGAGPRAGFVVHMNNETIHHGAEVGVLRDLWRAGMR